jgi:hypothetical protein
VATTWISLALALVKLGNMLFEHFRSSALEQAGENRQALKSLQAMQEVSNSLKLIDEKFDKMTDEEVRDEITKQGDWRD